MAKTYVYLHHQGFDFYLTDRPLTPDERYCAICEDADRLIAVCRDADTLTDTLRELYAQGYGRMER